jgi:hypothetical protein
MLNNFGKLEFPRLYFMHSVSSENNYQASTVFHTREVTTFGTRWDLTIGISPSVVKQHLERRIGPLLALVVTVFSVLEEPGSPGESSGTDWVDQK